MPFDLEVSCRQAEPAPVLRARRVSLSQGVRNDGTPIATVSSDVPGSDQDLLVRQLTRRVDVRGVRS